MLFKILSVILKIITALIFTYDTNKTRKLLSKNKNALRSNYWYQKVEIVVINVLAYAQILIPLSIMSKPYITTLIEFVILIITYIHLNRWVFIGKNVIITRCEEFDLRRVIQPSYNKHILHFRSGNREFDIHFPLNTDERINKYLK